MDLVCVLDFYGKKEYYFSQDDFSCISELEERILSGDIYAQTIWGVQV